MSITMSNPSIVHTFGNVACVAVEYLKAFFGENYFTKIHISTKMAHRQLNVYRAKTGFWKNKKPMLVLRPRIDWEGTNNWWYGSSMMKRQFNSLSPMEFADRIPLIEDEENHAEVQFIWNRYKVQYDCVIILDTYNQQVNIMNDLINQLAIEVPYRLETFLEAYIPKSVIYSLVEYVGIDINNTAKVLDYLNTHSKVPITYKLHKGSGHNEFFMMYPTKVEIICSDLQPDDGENHGLIMDTFTIGLAMSLEFNAVGVWYTFLDDKKEEFRKAPMDESFNEDEQNRIIPLSSIPLGYDLGLKEGWKILESPFYKAIPDKNGIDTTDISSILDSNTIKMILRHHLKMNIPLSSFLQFRVFCDTIELSKGIKGYDISLKNKCIYTYNADPSKSYRIFVIVNTLAINNMAAEITNFKTNENNSD